MTIKHLLLLTTSVTSGAFTTQPIIAEQDPVFYFSLHHSIRQGQYDPIIPAGQLAQFGNFGLGSESMLSSELILLDDTAYAVAADGIARKMPDTSGIAFAVIKNFAADTLFRVNGVLSFDQLKKQLSRVIGNNKVAAIRIACTFEHITYRSFRKQEKPYQPIKKSMEVRFRKHHVTGTLVGFYTPASMAALNTPVYHFHFISADKTTGGHVHHGKLSGVTISIDYANELRVRLPVGDLIKNVNLNEKARPED